PYSNTRSVAELVLAEAILLLRGVPEKSAVAHRGGWLKSAENAYEIRGKTLGIVGYGSIGAQLSVLAEA
ncbi:phosphoglycerate dehydrogenase, partial [Mycobacterium tuberculosis]